MKRPLRSLPRLSYQSQFLWRLSLAIIALGVAAGLVVHHFAAGNHSASLPLPFGDAPQLPPSAAPPEPAAAAPTLAGVLTDPQRPFHQKLAWLAIHVAAGQSDPGDQATIREAFPDPAQRDIALALAKSLSAPGGEAAPELLALSQETPPPPNARFALGLFYRARNLPYHAAAQFEAEGERPGAAYARNAALATYWAIPSYVNLARLSDHPAYQEELRGERAYLKFRSAIATKDWPGIVHWLAPAQYSATTASTLLIGTIVGLAWLSFLVHLGGYWQDRPRFLLGVGAVALGGLSTWLTILVVIWQREYLGFQQEEGLIRGLIYCIAGIGLREELIKLLFFAPLLPLLLRFKDPMLALVAGGCVGLGFAIEENIGYFHATPEFVGPARFLTANFFHISATALCAYALYQVVRDRGRSFEHFLSIFVMVVVIHGLYDAFLMVPELMEYSVFSMTAYVYLCFQLFELIDRLGHRPSRKISLSFVFTLCLSIVLATCLGYAVSGAGLFLGLQAFGASFLGVGLIVIMFFRVIAEPIR